MQTYRFSELTEETLDSIVTLHEKMGVSDDWEEMQRCLTAEERKRIDVFRADLEGLELIAMNEATLWSRVIYPLLVLAEQEHIRAWAGVPLKATYATFQLEGEADGVLAPCILGRMRRPYFVVHEAKRGVNAPDPLYQLLGEMLAAAWLNWKKDTTPNQEIFGCYTVAESWAFVRGVVGEMDAEKPTFAVEKSLTYNGVSGAERIVQILKAIVAKHLSPKTNGGAEHANLSLLRIDGRETQHVSVPKQNRRRV